MNNQLQSLLHDSLLGTGHCESCALFRKKDFSLRASSPGFALNAQEMQSICDSLSDSNHTREQGFDLRGVHYKAIRSDRFSIYGKQGNQGVVIVRTATMVVVATYSQDMFASVCVEAAEKLADYLREKGR